MEFKIFELGPAATNAILVFERSTQQAVLFDTPLDSYNQVSRFCEAESLTLNQVLMTHGHWDHMIDLHHFNAAGIPAWGHRDDQVMFEQPQLMAAYALPGLKFESGKIDRWVSGGEKLQFLDRDWETRHVPGHCHGSLLFWSQGDAVAIVGDAIFAGSVGRTDLPGGDTDLLLNSIKREIYSLPDSTILYPGHGPETEVGRETRTNPFVRG